MLAARVPKYDEFMKERKEALMPASERARRPKSTPSSQDAIH